jgi:hypothetical protein
MKSAELDAHAARFNERFRSLSAYAHFNDVTPAGDKTPSFMRSRLVH